MGFSAKLEADLTNWSRNINKAGNEFDNFASKTQKDINAINNSFKQINGNSIGGLQNRLTLLKQNLENATDIKSIAKYNIRIRDTQDEIAKLKNLGLQAGNATKNIVTPSTTTGLKSLTQSFGAANGVAMEFNRIIQDAPFGMMGIGNNIQQLTSNFALLKSQTGSTGSAIKATFASVLSSGNLLALGVATITSAWTAYTMWSQRSNKATKDNKDEFDKLVESLSETSTVMYDAAKSSGREAAELRALYSISQDTTQSVDERKNAAQRLIKQYPELFGKFNSEQVMLGKAKIAYDELSKSILATARAQAAYGKIGEKVSEQIAIDEANKAIQKEIDLTNQLIKVNQAKGQSLAGSISQGNTAEEARDLAAASDALKSSAGLREKVNELNKQYTDNLLKRASLQEGINDLEKIAISNQVDINNQFGIGVEKVKDLTDKIAGLKDELNQFIQAGRDQGLLITQLENIDIKYNAIYKVIQEIGNVDPFKVALVGGMKLEEQLDSVISKMKTQTANPLLNFTLPNIQTGQLDKSLGDLKANVYSQGQEVAMSFNDGFSKILQDSVAMTVTNLATDIGSALAEGGNILTAMGKSLLGSMGSILIELGKMAIKTGAGILAVKIALKSLNPYVAIAAGAGLIAIGAAFSSSARNLGTSMGSGGYSGGYSANISSSSDYSEFRGARYDNSRQVVQLELKNGNLMGAIKWGEERNNRLS